MTTPWDEARREALSALFKALTQGGPAFDKEGEPITAEEAGLNTALATLSRLGYAIVPKVATEEMIAAAASKIGPIKAMTEAATEAGDVLKVKP